MRISDWSSDVCTSDLPELCTQDQFLLLQLYGGQWQMLKLFNMLIQEPINVIENICEHARTQLEARGVKPIFAIDEAQIAAKLCADDTAGAFAFKREGSNQPRSLLYAYARKER